MVRTKPKKKVKKPRKEVKAKKAKPQDYKTLKTIWYKKLTDSGFEDIEQNEFYLKKYSTLIMNHNDPITYEAKETYYRIGEHFLNEHRFNSRLEKVIWEYHINGISVTNISILLKETKVAKISRDTVWAIVNRLSNEMKKIYLIK